MSSAAKGQEKATEMGAGASTAYPDGLESELATLHTLEGHTSYVNGVAVFLLPDGTPRALSGSDDKTVRVWDPVAGKALHTLQGHTGQVLGVAAFTLPDGTPRAVSGSDDCTVRVWNPVAGTALHTLKGHTRDVECVAAFTLPDGTPRALSGSRPSGYAVDAGPHFCCLF